jgi:proliferating cell nuclear antigen
MELLRVSPRNPRAWKSASDAVASFLADGTFHFTEKGVWLQSIDPSMVVFVKLEAPRDVFSEYVLNYPEVRVPISLSEYQRILSRLSPGDRLTLSFSSTNLYVVMEGQGIRKEFVIPAIDIREESRPVSLPSSLSYVELPASYIKEALKNASVVSREVTLRISDDKFVVESREGSNVSKTEIAASPYVKIVYDQPTSSKYSIDYLQNILKPADSTVILEFSNDSPLKVSYSLEGIRLTFILAPLML